MIINQLNYLMTSVPYNVEMEAAILIAKSNLYIALATLVNK